MKESKHCDRLDLIRWCRSLRTGREFPKYTFSGDTDMVTAGLVSLTSAERNEIVRTQLTDEEYAAGYPGGRACSRRVNAALGRTDLRFVELLRLKNPLPPPLGLSMAAFSEHKARYPDRLVYSDIFGPDGEAVEVRTETVWQFQEGGGSVLDHEFDV